jgi:hypothetical protein
MTDTSPGPGWWLASDGRWYPPHLHPDVRGRDDINRAKTGTAAPDRNGTPPSASDTSANAGSASDASAPAADLTGPTESIVVPRVVPGWPTADPHAAPFPREPRPSAFATPAQTLPPYTPREPVPPREPIDWDRVRDERLQRRKAEDAHRRRRMLAAVGVAVLALLVIWLVARNETDDGDRSAASATTAAKVGGTDPKATAASTTAAPTTTAAATTTSTAGPTTTAAGATTTAAGAPTTAATPVSSPVSVFSLQAGNCIDNADLTTGLVTTVTKVACDQPHTHEVYLKATYTPTNTPYNAEQVTNFANKSCTDGFAAYVGIPYDKSKYYFLHLAPSAESWNQNNDRDVMCLLFLQGAKLTASAKGKAE